MATTVGIKFLYTFSVGEFDLNNPGVNIISVTSQAAGDHSPTNLTTTPLRQTWRSDSGIGSFQEIVIQANDTAVVPDVFALLNHNFTDIATVQLLGSMTTDFTGATTIPFTWTKKNLILLQDIGTAFNYYQIRILDPTNPCGFVEVGRIIGGRSFTMTDNEDITDSISIKTKDLAYRTNTEGFFRAFNERVKVDQLSIRFQKLVTETGLNANYLGLLDLMDTVGETFPFLTIVDPDDQTFANVWGQIETLPGRSFGINRFVDFGFNIGEIF